MKYGLDDKPGVGPLLLYGAQWWVVTLPCVIILGNVVARMHFGEVAAQMFYMQKLLALTGLVTIVQVLWGHRLPLVVGPASTLLVGIVASTGAGYDAVYTSIAAGGAVLAILAYGGLMSRLRAFFTPRIVAVILVLIAFTLTPTIITLLTSGGGSAFDFGFALVMVFALVLCNTLLPGIWKSMTVIAGLALGSLGYFLAKGLPGWPGMSAYKGAAGMFLTAPDLDPGTLLAFLFCFLALSINELGSVESIGQMLNADRMDSRIKRGVGMQGLANGAAGALGVIGTVDFSLSAGVIAATGCASRYTLIPAGAGLFACALFPNLVLALTLIPGVVMGALMIYLMSSQLASGLAMLMRADGVSDFNGGMTVGLPLMIGIIISFMPKSSLEHFPALLAPIAGNGFVMGTIAVIVLEHVIFRHKGRNS